MFQSLTLASRIVVLDKTLVHHRVNRMDSVSNSRRLKPEAPYKAVILLWRALEQRGVYRTFERSFLNWAMNFLIWNAANMGERRSQKLYFQTLKREWLPQMKFESRPRSYYRDHLGWDLNVNTL